MLVCLLGIAFQAQAASAAVSSQASSFREVKDETGRLVRIPKTIKRIVSLAPSLTETLYALGLQDSLVGDTDFCDYPAEARTKPRVGGAVNPNIEQVVSLRPDLVLVTESINRLETVRALDALGIPSYSTADPHTVAGIVASIRQLAGVLGVPEAGASVAKQLDDRLSALHSELAGRPPVTVLFVVWPEPLISAGKNTFIADAIRLAGGASIVDSAQSWPQVSLEEVVRLQPEYLIFAAANPKDPKSRVDELTARSAWKNLDAVRFHRFAVISDAVNRPAPRIVSAIEALARQIHPEAFSAPASSIPSVLSPGSSSHSRTIVSSFSGNSSRIAGAVSLERSCRP